MSGAPPYGFDHSTWATGQFPMPVNRKNPADLSPGRSVPNTSTSATNKVMVGIPAAKPTNNKKGIFGLDDEDAEASMYFNNAILRPDNKDIMTTSVSPSQLAGFGGNFYNQPTGNVNLQQRGMSNTTFPRSSTDQVTPTSMSSMSHSFPLNMHPQQQQQGSPNRNLLGNLARGFPSLNQNQMNQALSSLQKRSNPISSAILSSSANASTPSSVAQSLAFGRGGNFFGYEGQASLDMTEFPSLGNRSGIQQNPISNAARNYVGMVKTQNQDSAAPEFQIQIEDFPALPGSQNVPPSTGNELGNKTSGLQGLGNTYNQAVNKEGSTTFPVNNNKANGAQSKRGIQTSPDGTVSNIPGGMVMDQFGMVGLLTFIRSADTDPNLVALAPGIDLTTLGLNLNSPDNLYSTFQSPWADSPCRPQDIDFHVPTEYLCNIFLRDKLAPIKLNRYGDELLFLLFYMNGGDVLQLAAAAELYQRDWRYHREERVWMTRAPGMEPQAKTNTYERGTYYFFDPQNWRKVAKEFHLEYDKLEERPHLPPAFATQLRPM